MVLDLQYLRKYSIERNTGFSLLLLKALNLCWHANIQFPNFPFKELYSFLNTSSMLNSKRNTIILRTWGTVQVNALEYMR